MGAGRKGRAQREPRLAFKAKSSHLRETPQGPSEPRCFICGAHSGHRDFSAPPQPTRQDSSCTELSRHHALQSPGSMLIHPQALLWLSDLPWGRRARPGCEVPKVVFILPPPGLPRQSGAQPHKWAGGRGLT